MTIYKVCGMINKEDKVIHQVIPYSLVGTLNSFFSKDINYSLDGSYGLFKRIKSLCSFFERCHLSKSKAEKEAKFLDCSRDLEW